MINLQMKVMLQLMKLSPPNFLKKAAKPSPVTFSMEHLLYRLYGVDAPVEFTVPSTASPYSYTRPRICHFSPGLL